MIEAKKNADPKNEVNQAKKVKIKRSDQFHHEDHFEEEGLHQILRVERKF